MFWLDTSPTSCWLLSQIYIWLPWHTCSCFMFVKSFIPQTCWPPNDGRWHCRTLALLNTFRSEALSWQTLQASQVPQEPSETEKNNNNICVIFLSRALCLTYFGPLCKKRHDISYYNDNLVENGPTWTRGIFWSSGFQKTQVHSKESKTLHLTSGHLKLMYF